MEFLEPGVLVELTYDLEGHPITICRGKVRDREKDKAASLAWLRALKAQIDLLAAVEAAERTNGEISSVLQVSPDSVSRNLLKLERLGSVRRREARGRVVWERAPELPRPRRSA